MVFSSGESAIPETVEGWRNRNEPNRISALGRKRVAERVRHGRRGCGNRELGGSSSANVVRETKQVKAATMIANLPNAGRDIIGIRMDTHLRFGTVTQQIITRATSGRNRLPSGVVYRSVSYSTASPKFMSGGTNLHKMQ